MSRPNRLSKCIENFWSGSANRTCAMKRTFFIKLVRTWPNWNESISVSGKFLDGNSPLLPLLLFASSFIRTWYYLIRRPSSPKDPHTASSLFKLEFRKHTKFVQIIPGRKLVRPLHCVNFEMARRQKKLMKRENELDVSGKIIKIKANLIAGVCQRERFRSKMLVRRFGWLDASRSTHGKSCVPPANDA